MTKIIFDNQEMSIGERDRKIKEMADFTRSISQQEAKEGITVFDETNLQFFKEG